jgi:hypothetical protein
MRGACLAMGAQIAGAETSFCCPSKTEVLLCHSRNSGIWLDYNNSCMVAILLVKTLRSSIAVLLSFMVGKSHLKSSLKCRQGVVTGGLHL